MTHFFTWNLENSKLCKNTIDICSDALWEAFLNSLHPSSKRTFTIALTPSMLLINIFLKGNLTNVRTLLQSFTCFRGWTIMAGGGCGVARKTCIKYNLLHPKCSNIYTWNRFQYFVTKGEFCKAYKYGHFKKYNNASITFLLLPLFIWWIEWTLFSLYIFWNMVTRFSHFCC